MTEQAGSQALFDLWKQQLDEATQAWQRMMAQGQAVDPSQFWRPFMDQGIAAWSKLLTQGPVTPDLQAQWKQFLDQWIAAWGKVLERAMGTEAFAQALGNYLEQWLALQGPARRATAEASEAALSALGVPSRAQVTGLARQLGDIEDRLESLEDRVGELVTLLGAFKALAEFEKVKAPSRGGAGKETG